MRSRAHYLKGHPIHPVLVSFPIAFLLGAFIFDAIGVTYAAPGWYTAGKYLAGAGLVMGLAAAVPGLIDYLFTIPPDSSGKRHARRHLLLNVTVLLLFAVAFWVRGAPGVPPDPPILGLELLAVLLLTWSGWIGGTLVYRNQIGVDHRYAGAGQWREVRVSARPGEAVVVPGAEKLKPDQMLLVHAGGQRIVLARLADGWAAFDDRCPHRGGSLADGTLACGTVQCPWHGSQFDVRTGDVRAGPATEGIERHAVEAVGSEVRLVLRATTSPPAPA